MKKLSLLMSVTAVLVLAGCAQGLNPDDRSLLLESKNLAQQAKDQAASAAQASQLASEQAAKAAKDAESASGDAATAAGAAMAASEKADRIFKKGSDK